MALEDLFHVGQSREETFRVGEEHTAYHIGSGESRVLSTPSMISFMEQVAHRLLEAALPDDLISVGIQVDIQHLAATPVDAEVRVRAEILDIDGRRVNFAVQAHDHQELVGKGTHRRAAVDRTRFSQGIAAKKEQLKKDPEIN